MSADSVPDARVLPLRHFALLEAGFRVFFLLAPLYAASAILEWLLTYAGAITLPADIAPTLWHEMIFGFAAGAWPGSS